MTVRCNTCGTRRSTFVALLKHKRDKGHGKNCTCGGYHFPHRPGSPCCEENGFATWHRAKRAGATPDELLDAFIDDALFGKHKPQKDQTCPF
jgi:uncharacterized protein (DUF2237 family)